eukprot:gb/GECH01012916.1/.p1 GENE.gb/GECH01012916.1/~~gb/GECH01012916.1/.p1  ORF type:complete len:285 (+),score=68.30 gb/GECH01012916.1/:1-855(+)
MVECNKVGENKCFGGYVRRYEHQSSVTRCKMTFSVYIPPKNKDDQKFPILYYLSGLTCTDQNFITKSGAQQYAAKHGIILIAPDTSPRGIEIEGEDDSYDFGTGAGFYVDATEEKWRSHYNMYSYVVEELPSVIKDLLPEADPDRVSITGHSMGGHGALICFLKNPNLYKSVSAFAPICNPINCDWGKKAFSGYLGSNQESWKAYDASELVQAYDGPKTQILIDQGTADNFLSQKQLLPEAFEEACKKVNCPLDLRMQDGYDHSYYFISTFMGEHIEFHAKHLN